MNLTLDYEQRLYLHLLLGNLECHTVKETRLAWELMDRIALDPIEKQHIDFKVQIIDQQEAYTWDVAKTSVMKEFYNITDSDIQQISRALANCPKFLPRQVRRWLEPLLQQLPQLDTPNGGR